MISKIWKSIPILVKFFLIFLLGGLFVQFFGYHVRSWFFSPKKGQTVEEFEEKIENKSETLIEIYPPEKIPLENRSIYKFTPAGNN